jgi:hypothetical protein
MMSKFFDHLRTSVLGIAVSLLVGIPSIGILIPNLFSFLIVLCGSVIPLRVLTYIFIGLYLLLPVLIYWLLPKIVIPYWRSSTSIVGKPLMTITAIFPILTVIGVIAFTGSDPFMDSWSSDYDRYIKNEESILRFEQQLAQQQLEKSLGVKGKAVNPVKLWLEDSAKSESKPILLDKLNFTEAKKLNKAAYSVKVTMHNAGLKKFLLAVQVAGLIYFSILFFWLLYQIRNSFVVLHEVEDESPLQRWEKLILGLREGILLTVVLLVVPLIKPLEKRIEKPSELVTLANWDPTRYYVNRSSTSYRTTITHYGKDNTFAIDSIADPSMMNAEFSPDTITLKNVPQVQVSVTSRDTLVANALNQINETLIEIEGNQDSMAKSMGRFIEGAIESKLIKDPGP